MKHLNMVREWVCWKLKLDDDVKKEFGLIRHNFNPNLTGDPKSSIQSYIG